MQNKNFNRKFNRSFNRELNKVPKPQYKKYDWETIAGGILLTLVIISFSILSYGFWGTLIQITGRR